MREENRSAAPLILSAALPSALQSAADRLRPAGRAAHAPAHLSLFRHLPGAERAVLLREARQLMAETAAPVATLLPPVQRERRWLAPVAAPELDVLREAFARRWHGLLAPGDIAPPRLHISLSDAAPSAPFPPGPWRLPGLLLWQYGEACWTPLVALRFRR